MEVQAYEPLIFFFVSIRSASLFRDLHGQIGECMSYGRRDRTMVTGMQTIRLCFVNNSQVNPRSCRFGNSSFESATQSTHIYICYPNVQATLCEDVGVGRQMSRRSWVGKCEGTGRGPGSVIQKSGDNDGIYW